MGKNYIIEPSVILSLVVEYDGVSISITNDFEILNLYFFNSLFIKNKLDEFIFKQRILEVINKCIEQYEVDTFILEENKLLIDRIDRYPDPYILRNKLLDYSLQISLEDAYLKRIKYYMVLPHFDWFTTIFNKQIRYSVDLYKSHILDKGFNGSDDLFQEFKSHNYYKVLCLSECAEYSKLMNKKYQINYERGGNSEG